MFSNTSLLSISSLASTSSTVYYCQQNSCNRTVSNSGEYCIQHQNYCQESSCYARVSSLGEYCSSHQMHYCEVGSCYEKTSYSEIYCSGHRNICSSSSCWQRISSGETYCSSHKTHACFSCSTQIFRYQTYCSNHVSSCAEYNCLVRVSFSQKYCLSHKKQTLQEWWEEGKITEEERKKLNELNLNGEHTLKQLKEVLEEDAFVNDSPIIGNAVQTTDFQTIIRNNLSNSLKRVRPKLALFVAEGHQVPEPPIEITPFSTWFNADCTTIVSSVNF